MKEPESIREYARTAAAQLRWEKARSSVERELETHLLDQRDALMRSGMTEEEATRESIRRTGDAVALGSELDRVHRPKPAWSLFILTAALLLTGIGIKLFVTYDGDAPEQLIKCLFAALLGGGCLMGAYFLDFTLIAKAPLAVFFGPMLIICGWSALRALPGIAYGAVYAVLLLPLALAALIYRLRGKGVRGVLLTFLGFVALSGCCCAAALSAGIFILLAAALALMALAAREDWFCCGGWRTLGLFTLLTFAALAALILSLPEEGWVIRSVLTAIDPYPEADGLGRRVLALRELIAGARFMGRGELGRVSAETTALGMDSDYVLTLLIHELGWIAFAVIMALFVAFLAVGFYKAFGQKSALGRLVSLAVMLTLAGEVLVYVCANLGYPVFMPISLPLVSYGNTATVVNMTLIGVLLSCFRTGSLVRDTPRRAAVS